MAEARTRPTSASVTSFIGAVGDPERRRDCRTVMKMMAAATGKRPKMWGPNIVGYGSYHYRYESGHEGDAPVIGFSPRGRELVIYVSPGLQRFKEQLGRLGRHRTGKSCLYLKRLADVDLQVLEGIVSASVTYMHERYRCA